MHSNGLSSYLVIVVSSLAGYRDQRRDTAAEKILFVSIDTASSLMQSRSIEKYGFVSDPGDPRLEHGDIFD